MALILHIDTATESATVSLALSGSLLDFAVNHSQKDHAGFLQLAIKSLFNKTGYQLKELDAVAVSNGPGSYTGLRVGLSSAKGLCFALNKPLITIGSLDILAFDAFQSIAEIHRANSLVCSMIDARRMEVFTAIFNYNMIPVLEPCALILTADSYANFLEKQPIHFVGNGAEKFRKICKHERAFFPHQNDCLNSFIQLSYKAYINQQFANLVYCEPLYVKAFQDSVIHNQ